MFRREWHSGSCIAVCMVAWLLSSWPEVSWALEDPTRPPGKPALRAKPASASVQLDYVLFSEQRRIAQINGRLMSEGDTVAGISLEQVTADGVIVRVGNGEPKRLSLSSIKVHKEIK